MQFGIPSYIFVLFFFARTRENLQSCKCVVLNAEINTFASEKNSIHSFFAFKFIFNSNLEEVQFL